MKVAAAVVVLAVARSVAAPLKIARAAFGPKDCVSVSRSSVGSCVLSTDCKGSDLSKTEFAFNCVDKDEVVRHSYGFGGFDVNEEFDTGTKCDRCTSPSARRAEPTHAAKVPARAAAAAAATARAAAAQRMLNPAPMKPVPRTSEAKVSHKSASGEIKMTAKLHQHRRKRKSRHTHLPRRRHRKQQDNEKTAGSATSKTAAATASAAGAAAAATASEAGETAAETTSDAGEAAAVTASEATKAAAETSSEAGGAAAATASEAGGAATGTASGLYKTTLRAAAKHWPFYTAKYGEILEAETVKYGPEGCVSTYKSKEGHCIMSTDCKGVDISEYEFGVVCVDKRGSPVKHLFGKDSFDQEEHFDTLIKCEQCLGLDEVPNEVRLSGEVATMSKDIRSMTAMLKNVSINVQILNDKVFNAARTPAPTEAPPATEEDSAPAVLVHHIVRHRRHKDHATIVQTSPKRNVRHSRKVSLLNQRPVRWDTEGDDDRSETLQALARAIDGAIDVERELKKPELQLLSVPAAVVGRKAADDGDNEEGYDAD